jgi:3-dehydroquinate synthase
VNTRAGKNLVGAFHQPAAVLIDTETLRTLPPRELTAGWCEAIKQGAVGDRKLFERTRKFLEDEARRKRDKRRGERNEKRVEERDERRDEEVDEKREEELSRIIAAQCAFKAEIVAGDEREEVSRADARSRRVLNFGHTVGHALEALTAYRRFRHGEAVGHGMRAAARIAERLEMLTGDERRLIDEAVWRAGPLPSAKTLALDDIISAMAHDKKAEAGHLAFVLPTAIGRVVVRTDVPLQVIRSALKDALFEQPL